MFDRFGKSVADAGGQVETLDRKAGALHRTVDGLGRAGGRGFSALASGAKAAGTIIGTAAVAAGGFGLKVASQNEQASISFTTMLGSATKAKKFLGDLQAFAAKTPFEFPELQTAASSLISAGINASKVIPIMTTLGNVTSGMGTGSEGVQRATIALQQMSAAGRITGEDLNQLRDAGIPVYDLLAAATGKSKAKVLELAQAGKLGSKELGQLMEALESGKGLERFSGLMDKQSQSLSGMWSTMKDTFGQGLARAIEPALPTIKKAMQGVSDQASSFFAGLSGEGKLKGFAGTANEIGLGLRAMIAAFKEGDATSSGLVGKFERAGVAGRQLWLGLQALVAAYREGDVTSEGFVGTMERLGAGTRRVFDYVRGTAVPAVQEWFSTLRSGGGDTEQVGRSFGSIADSLAKIGPAVQGANTSLPSFADTLSVGSAALAFLADNIDTVVKFMPLLVAGVIAYKTAQALANVAAILAVPMKIAEIIVNRQLVASNRELIASRVGVTAATVGGTVAETASTAAKQAGILASIRSRVAALASAAASLVVRGATLAWTGAQWLLNAALTANPIGLVIAAIALLAAGIVIAWKRSETFRDIVKGAFGGVADAGRSLWEKVLKPVFGFIVGAWLAVAGGIVNGAAKAFGWVPGLGGKLKDAAKSFNAFRDQVNGALSGVKSKTVTVTAKASVLMGQGMSRSDAIATSLHRASGGPVFGRGTETSDSIAARLSHNEHVWSAREVRGAGGHDQVAAIRKMAAAGRLPGFAAGGAVRFDVLARSGGLPQFRAGLEDLSTTAEAAATAAARRAATAMATQLGGGSVMGWQAQMAALQRVFPGLPLISGFRPGSITATGNRSYHASGRAVDIPPRMDVFNWIRATYGARSKELIFSPAAGRQLWNGRAHMYGEPTRGDHWDHVHWAMANGGVINEPVLGVGLRTGGRYSFGERGPETVTPGVGGGSTVINVHLHGLVGRPDPATITRIREGVREALRAEGKADAARNV